MSINHTFSYVRCNSSAITQNHPLRAYVLIRLGKPLPGFLAFCMKPPPLLTASHARTCCKRALRWSSHAFCIRSHTFGNPAPWTLKQTSHTFGKPSSWWHLYVPIRLAKVPMRFARMLCFRVGDIYTFLYVWKKFLCVSPTFLCFAVLIIYVPIRL